MKKGILIIVVIIAVLFGAIYYFSVAGEKSAYMVKVTIQTEGSITQGNVTGTRLGEPVAVFPSQRLRSNTLRYPGMTVGVLEIPNMTLISSWRHGHYNGTGVYDIEVDLKRNFRDGEWVRVIHYLYDPNGTTIYSGVRDFRIEPKGINVKQNNT